MSIDIVLAIVLIAAAFFVGFSLGCGGKAKNASVQGEPYAEGRSAAGVAVPHVPDAADRGRFDAAVAAAIATYLGEGVKGLRIRSMRRLGGEAPLRQPMVAAVSAAIATHMGTDVSALRIHSIRRIGGAATGRQRMVAAISAAIAETMNTQIDGLRIRSIKKIS